MEDERTENQQNNRERKRKAKPPRIEITELFMAKCGKNGCDR
jgi:hypothetical protein